MVENNTIDLKNNMDSVVNTSYCTKPDAYDLNVVIDVGEFNALMLWEGGIAFSLVFWSIISIIVFSSLYVLRRSFGWKFLTERFRGTDTTLPNIKGTTNWKDWLFFTINEEVVGRDGATYLWFHYRLIQLQGLTMILSIVLIIMHFYGDKLGEVPVKTLRSTGLNNIGANGAHSVFCGAILTTLVWLMKKHGNSRWIRSLASHGVSNRSSVCNRRWLMISGIPLTVTSDSFFEYLKSQFDIKGINRDGILLSYDATKLLPVVDKLTFVSEIKNNITEPINIRRRFWECWADYQSEDAWDYYSKQEESLLAEKTELLKNLEFTGTIFIKFDSSAESKTAKIILKQYQTNWFWNRNGMVEDVEFQPSKWTIRYAPPGSEINWKQLKKPMSNWKTVLIWLMILTVYLAYVILMAAPGSTVRWLHLDGYGMDRASVFWKSFMLPTIASFFTTKLTDWVTKLDKHRRHLTVTKMFLASLRSSCYLEITLYLIRMMAIKPLPLILAGMFNSQDFRWECLFFPVHGCFITSAIIVNTISGILMDHMRYEFLWPYFKKWFTFRSDAEQVVYEKTFKFDFDYPSNYAELSSNFALITLLIMIFPVIGLVSWVLSIVRFWSERSALMNIYPVTRIGHDLHKEAIDMAMRSAIASPIALLVYRRIQLGHNIKFLDAGIIAPLCLLILYLTYLGFAHFKLNGALPKWFRRLFRLKPLFKKDDDLDDGEEDPVDSLSHLVNEYDPIAGLRTVRLPV